MVLLFFQINEVIPRRACLYPPKKQKNPQCVFQTDRNGWVSFSKGFCNFSFSIFFSAGALWVSEIRLCEIYPPPPTSEKSLVLQLSPPLTSFLPLSSPLPHLFLTNSFSDLPIYPPPSISSYCLHPVTPAAVEAAGFVASEQYRLCASSPCCLPSPLLGSD